MGGARFDGDTMAEEAQTAVVKCACGKEFRTLQQLSVHRYKKHQIHAPEFELASSATCPICLRFFWTNVRMRSHLAYAPRSGRPNWCYEHLKRLGREPDIPPTEDRIPDEVKHFRRLQALPVQGPVGFGCAQRELDLRKAIEDLDKWQKQAYEEDTLAFPTYDQKQFWFGIFEETTDRWFDKVQSPDHDWPCIQYDWLMASEQESEPDFISGGHVFCQWGEERLSDFLESWEDRELAKHVEESFECLCNDWEPCQARKQFEQKIKRIRALQREEELPTTGHRAVRRGHANAPERQRTSLHVPQEFENTCKWENKFYNMTFDQWAADRRTPRWNQVAEAPIFLVVHLFSGRRREGDVHFWLNKFATEAEIQLVVLSLDTAVDGDLGNLFHRGVPWAHLEVLLSDGRVAALVAGSPCETYSAARHNVLEEGKTGPRPLRSSFRLWGLAGLRVRELRQLRLGSLFQLQVLWALLQMRVTGGIGVSEHPGTPREEEKASIWRSGLVTLMLKDGHFALHQLPQFLFGAHVVKMTGFLCLRLPWFRRHLLEHQIVGAKKPEAHAIGVDHTGTFRTSALKEYPPKLCAGLAWAVIRGLKQPRRCGPPPDGHLPAAVSEWIESAAAVSAEIRQDACWLPDYQG